MFNTVFRLFQRRPVQHGEQTQPRLYVFCECSHCGNEYLHLEGRNGARGFCDRCAEALPTAQQFSPGPLVRRRT